MLTGPRHEPYLFPDPERVPINVAPEVRQELRELLYHPGLRGVGYSEFIKRAVAAAKAELGGVMAETLTPRKGWGYVGCTKCGHVEDLPLDLAEELPWCPHGDRMVWRTPHPKTQEGIDPWTRAVRVEVRPL